MRDYESLLSTITADPHYLRNLDWGTRRPGHNEGTVRAHIHELERNLEQFNQRVSEADYWKLKILIHTHDTFKPDSAGEGAVPISDPKSHASLARAFLAKYTDDQDLLTMIQLHDEPFALWNQHRSRGKYNRDRFLNLLTSIQDWNLFPLFLIIDGSTDGKSREPLRWFLREIAGKVATTITPADIL